MNKIFIMICGPSHFVHSASHPTRFGFDVPVILRSSDDTESILPTPEKQMVQVTNPFALELASGPASVTGEGSRYHQSCNTVLCSLLVYFGWSALVIAASVHRQCPQQALCCDSAS